MQLSCCACHVQRFRQNNEGAEMPIFKSGKSMACLRNHNRFFDFRAQIATTVKIGRSKL
jgi:hypothetical protein